MRLPLGRRGRAATWVAGALVLRPVMHSPDIRWLVAAGLGVAVAALAALGGHSFVTRDTSEPPAGMSVTASGTGSIAVGGNISGAASTGRRRVNSRRPPAGNAGTRPDPDPGDGHSVREQLDRRRQRYHRKRLDWRRHRWPGSWVGDQDSGKSRRHHPVHFIMQTRQFHHLRTGSARGCDLGRSSEGRRESR